MEYKLIILPLAKIDLEEIASWYVIVNKNLGSRFLKSVKNEIKILRVKPHLYQIRYDGTRVALIETFPYLIHFEIDKKEILIKAIIHTSRNTKVWRNRNNY
ncbi:type II toxin-antitoxin system RelE/ParE family toxin [Flavobacterium sp.]|uniref:type II toxin-antitoxin system RelE/ParE family toxin n=1 Tax=Flavobacterium sp. TaxID=239 RepID=UPI00286C5617|nr:type II toxin-antitoxin system RelE/ParE family toxin [Flavobacterium sp.]